MFYPKLTLGNCVSDKPTGLNQLACVDTITTVIERDKQIPGGDYLTVDTQSDPIIAASVVSDSYQDLTSWNILFTNSFPWTGADDCYL